MTHYHQKHHSCIFRRSFSLSWSQRCILIGRSCSSCVAATTRLGSCSTQRLHRYSWESFSQDTLRQWGVLWVTVAWFSRFHRTAWTCPQSTQFDSESSGFSWPTRGFIHREREQCKGQRRSDWSAAPSQTSECTFPRVSRTTSWPESRQTSRNCISCWWTDPCPLRKQLAWLSQSFLHLRHLGQTSSTDAKHRNFPATHTSKSKLKFG